VQAADVVLQGTKLAVDRRGTLIGHDDDDGLAAAPGALMNARVASSTNNLTRAPCPEAIVLLKPYF
jgi:hypothetical protein